MTKISKVTVHMKDLVMVTFSFHLDKKFVNFILSQKTQNSFKELTSCLSMDYFLLILNVFHHFILVLMYGLSRKGRQVV